MERLEIQENEFLVSVVEKHEGLIRKAFIAIMMILGMIIVLSLLIRM